MGLTVHVGFKARGLDPAGVLAAVKQMRQIALDLPFEEVGKIVRLKGDQIDYNKLRARYTGKVPPKNWYRACRLCHSTTLPWNRCYHPQFSALEYVGFNVWPGEGSEGCEVGLALYPETIECEYDPREDVRFMEGKRAEIVKGTSHHVFSYRKFDRWRDKHGQPGKHFPFDYKEKRQVPTGYRGWALDTFCKTQYAGNPDCGGVANFLKCHITLITFLERCQKRVKGVRVTIDDEGDYGRHYHCPDYKYYDDNNLKRKYRWTPGKHDVKALAEELGEWDAFIAGWAGALKDIFPGQVETAMDGRVDFEKLEFKAHQDKELRPFLDNMAKVAQKLRDQFKAEHPEASKS